MQKTTAHYEPSRCSVSISTRAASNMSCQQESSSICRSSHGGHKSVLEFRTTSDLLLSSLLVCGLCSIIVLCFPKIDNEHTRGCNGLWRSIGEIHQDSVRTQNTGRVGAIVRSNMRELAVMEQQGPSSWNQIHCTSRHPFFSQGSRIFQV